MKITRENVTELVNEATAMKAVGLGYDDEFVGKLIEVLERVHDLLPKKRCSGRKQMNKAVIAAEKASKPKPKFHRVSDHALIRLMERKGGFNLDSLRSEVTQAIAPNYEEFGDGKYTIMGGEMTAVVKGGVVVTIT